MTIGEFGGARPVLPEFRAVLERYSEPFQLTADGEAELLKLLATGSQAVLATPAGPERDALLAEATQILEDAFSDATRRLHGAGLDQVDDRLLASVMQDFCPLPPFCYGGESDASITVGLPDDVGAQVRSGPPKVTV